MMFVSALRIADWLGHYLHCLTRTHAPPSSLKPLPRPSHPTQKPEARFILHAMRMQSEFDVNLTSQPSFRSNIRKWVKQSSTAANYPLRIYDVNIRFAFAFAGGMNRALVPVPMDRHYNNAWLSTNIHTKTPTYRQNTAWKYLIIFSFNGNPIIFL